MMHALARLALAAVVITACGSGDDAAATRDTGGADAGSLASAPARDACALITKAEADSIVGAAFGLQPRALADDKTACDYGPAVGPAGQSYQGFTLVVHWTGGTEAIEVGRRAAGAATDAAGGRADSVVSDVMGLRPLDGVGDEAYFGGRTMSYVRKGDLMLEFQLGGLDNPTPEHLRALATAALARIGG